MCAQNRHRRGSLAPCRGNQMGSNLNVKKALRAWFIESIGRKGKASIKWFDWSEWRCVVLLKLYVTHQQCTSSLLSLSNRATESMNHTYY